MPMNRPKIKVALLYHYMFPDDVVSARLFDNIGEELAKSGFEVEARPSNRSCRDDRLKFAPAETSNGVFYNRIWRPAFRQSRTIGRLLNAAWMISAWSGLALRSESNLPQVVIIGTDPVFAVLAALPLRWLRPRIKIIHWCHDLHPEAAVASGLVSDRNPVLRFIKALMGRAYRKCDVIADLGPTMRARLRSYGHGKPELEITPWALVEPMVPAMPDPATRRELFGDAKLAILYSGNFGEAHSGEAFLALARKLRDRPDIHFCFAIRGNHADKFRGTITAEDTNISFPGFAPIDQLEKRLAAADIHLVSLKPEWAGIAVPSKFFGSIASGRPVIYAGTSNSDIGTWIEKHACGWQLDESTLEQVADKLITISNDKSGLRALQKQVHETYQQQFSKSEMLGKLKKELQKPV